MGTTEKTVCLVFGIAALTLIGFLMIPPLMQKYSNKIYKLSLKKDEIDYENLGPEIVKKNGAKEE